jgi:hypothetical protein
MSRRGRPLTGVKHLSRRIRWGLAVLLAGTGACDDARQGAPDAIVSDSAGVRIVTNVGGPGELPWVVSAMPRVSIGGSAAPDSDQLFRVRGATRLSDGRLVVANAGSHELRFYDPDGSFVGASGREGDGPGEYRGIWLVHRLEGDSLLVYDQQSQRTSLLGPNGDFVRTVERERTADVSFSSVIGFYDDGSQLAAGLVDTGGLPPEGLQRFATDLYLFGPDGAFQAELGSYSTNETYFAPLQGGGFSFWDPIFGRRSVRLAAGDRFVFADNATFDIQVSDPDGALRMRIRRSEPAPRVEPRHVEAYEASRLEELTDENARRELERIFDEIDVPERFPAHGQVLHDPMGLLWVEVYREPGDDVMRWDVFGPDGLAIGRVNFPEILDPVFEIGPDYVLGLARDAFDVEAVHVYGLERR